MRRAASSAGTRLRAASASGSRSAAASATRRTCTRCSASSAVDRRRGDAATRTARRSQPRYEPIGDGEIIARLRRAASDGDLGSDDQSRRCWLAYQPKLLLARFGGSGTSPRPRALHPHPQAETRDVPTGWPEHYGHALAAELGLARYRTELVGNGARQYLVIERYDRAVDGETVTLIHQEDAAQALGLDWVDDHAKFQDQAPRDSRRPSAYRIAELLGSLQGEGRPVADFLRRLTFTVLLGDNDAHAKNLAILHLPGRSVLADVYDAVRTSSRTTSTTTSRSPSTAASTTGASVPTTSSARQKSWSALGTGEAEQVVARTLIDFAKSLDHVTAPRACPRPPQRSSTGTSNGCRPGRRSANDQVDTVVAARTHPVGL